MTDEDKALVNLLRADVFYGDARLANMDKHNPLHMDAADCIEAQAAAIEKLRANNLHLRSALAGIANAMADYTYVAVNHVEAISVGVKARARAALGETK